MLRALVFFFAMFALQLVPSAAQNKSSATDSLPPKHTDRSDAGGPFEISKQPSPHSESAAGLSSAEDSAAENELLGSANKSRELAGVPPLRMEESLREAARAHARRMVASDQLEHQLAGEPPLLERIAQFSLLKDALRIDRVGENIAYSSCATG